MRRVILILLVLSALVLSCEDGVAQGTIQFVWHGNSNFFNASFIVTDAEMQGAPLGSPEFTNSVSVSSLSGILYNSKSNDTLFLGNVTPWTFSLTFLDFNHNTEIFLGTAYFPVGGMAGDIREKPISGSDWYYETGYWTASQIPEPGTAALLGLGLAIASLRRRSGI